MHIGKLRGGSAYVIVRFTSRNGANNDCNCDNKGMTTFDYWKVPTASTKVYTLRSANTQEPVRLKVSGGRLVVDRKAKASGDMIRLNLLGQIMVPGFDRK